ncbi:hypothetical protein [Jeongeupia sp. USM3]|uniref:hypothetical protein n=1 Tax=Jeongeupia sp. USM3 TaxID=1906741 RepID=UPI0011AB46E5|nr:hypothetical protein [Jeongeupia sp. USM3]
MSYLTLKIAGRQRRSGLIDMSGLSLIRDHLEPDNDCANNGGLQKHFLQFLFLCRLFVAREFLEIG